jgi:pimeloyl-ACP methyl ester carboxylesterase
MSATLNLTAFGPGAASQHVDAAGTRLHVVAAGSSEPVVLIAGWPQSLWAWRFVLPELAKRRRVYAIDPPGMGDSAIPAPAYDVDAAAEIIHAVTKQLGLRAFDLVGHDIGAWLSYPFAARYPASVRKLVLMDAVIPGIVPMAAITPQNAHLAWHFGFNQIAELPEALTAGRERVFLEWFYQHRAHVTGAFTATDLDEYERIYTRPGAMTSGFAYYRSMGVSAEQNRAHSAAKLPMPVLVIAGSHGVGPRMIDAIVPGCAVARGVVIEKCGHYIPEEAPQRLVAELDTFLR